MKKYIILYHGVATDMSTMSKEQATEIMGKWAKWMEELGEGMVDVGQPMVGGQSVVDDGSESEVTTLNGYSIIQAKDIEEAKTLVKGHPYLSEGKGDFKVEVHELAPAPGM